MGIEIVFETHATSEDNERDIATGWLPGRLSASGRLQAVELGHRRRADGLTAVVSSDLRRAVETATIAFEGSSVPRFQDWRLRECNYGLRNGTPADDIRRSRARHIDVPYPGGESWRGAVARVSRFVQELPTRGASSRVLLIGHVATRWALEHHIDKVPLEQLVGENFRWQPGWEYHLGDGWAEGASAP